MGSIQFKRLISPDSDTSQLQQNVIDAFNNQSVRNPFLDGVLLKNVVLSSAATNKVSHTLGRTPVGYFIISKNANANVYDATAADLPTLFLYLNTTANVTVNLWVF